MGFDQDVSKVELLSVIRSCSGLSRKIWATRMVSKGYSQRRV